MFTSGRNVTPSREPQASRPARGSDPASLERLAIILSRHALAVSAALAIDAMNLERAMATAGASTQPDGRRLTSRLKPRGSIRGGREFIRRYQAAIEAVQVAAAPALPEPASRERASARGGARAYFRSTAGSAELHSPASQELELTA